MSEYPYKVVAKSERDRATADVANRTLQHEWNNNPAFRRLVRGKERQFSKMIAWQVLTDCYEVQPRTPDVPKEGS